MKTSERHTKICRQKITQKSSQSEPAREASTNDDDDDDDDDDES